MGHYVGVLKLNEEDGLTINIQLSPKNREKFDVPLEELFANFIGQEVYLEIQRMENMDKILEEKL